MRVAGQRLTDIAIRQPFLLRTAEPVPDAAKGLPLTELRRIGKRIAFGFDNDIWIVIHLMIAGRLHWHEQAPKPTRRMLASLGFESGVVTLTEAGTRRRAAMHVVAGDAALTIWIACALAAAPLLAIFAVLGRRYPDAGGVAAIMKRPFGDAGYVPATFLFLGAVAVGLPFDRDALLAQTRSMLAVKSGLPGTLNPASVAATAKASQDSVKSSRNAAGNSALCSRLIAMGMYAGLVMNVV